MTSITHALIGARQPKSSIEISTAAASTRVDGERRGDGGGEGGTQRYPALRWGGRGLRIADAIAGATNRLDELSTAGIALQLAAEVIDVDVHDVGCGLAFELPDIGKQLGAGDAFSAVEHEVLEQGELLGGKADLATGAMDLVADAVELNFTTAEDLVSELGAAAKEGAAAGGELEEAKGLQQAVVGAHVEAFNAGVKVVAAGQDEEGCAGIVGFELGEDLKTVAVAEANIKDDEVGLLFGDVAEGLVWMFEPLGGVAFIFKAFLEECSEVAITFEDEYTHGRSSPCFKSMQVSTRGRRGYSRLAGDML